jgi:hypothetical protein
MRTEAPSWGTRTKKKHCHMFLNWLCWYFQMIWTHPVFVFSPNCVLQVFERCHDDAITRTTDAVPSSLWVEANPSGKKNHAFFDETEHGSIFSQDWDAMSQMSLPLTRQEFCTKENSSNRDILREECLPIKYLATIYSIGGIFGSDDVSVATICFLPFVPSLSLWRYRMR